MGHELPPPEPRLRRPRRRGDRPDLRRRPGAATGSEALRLDRHGREPPPVRRVDLRALAPRLGGRLRRGQGRLHRGNRAPDRVRLSAHRAELSPPHLLRRARPAAARRGDALSHDRARLLHELCGELHIGIPDPHRRHGALLDLRAEGHEARQGREPHGDRRLHLLARYGHGPRLEPPTRGGPARRPRLHQHQDQPARGAR
jgi:hypothetical protein